MSLPSPLTVSDAPAKLSIWRDIDEKTFRKNVATLRDASDGKPGDPRVYSQNDWQGRVRNEDVNVYKLPFDVEQRIADDLAFLIATKGEAKTVSAAALEQNSNSEGLTVRLSTNNGVSHSAAALLKSIFQVIERCATKELSRVHCVDQIFDLVVEMNQECLHARIQSKHWKAPRNRGGPRATMAQRVPFVHDIERLIQRSSDSGDLSALTHDLEKLCLILRCVDKCTPRSQQEVQLLKDMVKHTYALCTPAGRPVEETLAKYGLNPEEAMQDSTVRRMNKIGRYWGLCEDLVKDARRYGDLFKSIHLQIVPRYQAYTPYPPLTLGGRITYYVHAEIQLLSFYNLNYNLGCQKPRVLGVSKGACYLCDLFVIKDRQFHITKTHGKLYHQWNFPDLKRYTGQQREEYRRILAEMNAHILRTIPTEKERKTRRPDLMESYVHLPLRFLPSPSASDFGTTMSQASLPHPALSSQGPPTVPSSTMWKEIIRTQVTSNDNNVLSQEKEPASTQTPQMNPTAQLLGPSVSSQPLAHSIVSHASMTSSNKSTTALLNPTLASTTSLATIRPSSPHQTPQTLQAASPATSTLSLPSITPLTTYPLHKALTSTKAFHTKTSSLHLTFEIEPHARGIVEISTLDEDNEEDIEGTGNNQRHARLSTPILDIAALPTDQTFEFNREDGNDEEGMGKDVVLHLRQPNINGNQISRIRLRWI